MEWIGISPFPHAMPFKECFLHIQPEYCITYTGHIAWIAFTLDSAKVGCTYFPIAAAFIVQLLTIHRTTSPRSFAYILARHSFIHELCLSVHWWLIAETNKFTWTTATIPGILTHHKIIHLIASCCSRWIKYRVTYNLLTLVASNQSIPWSVKLIQCRKVIPMRLLRYSMNLCTRTNHCSVSSKIFVFNSLLGDTSRRSSSTHDHRDHHSTLQYYLAMISQIRTGVVNKQRAPSVTKY